MRSSVKTWSIQWELLRSIIYVGLSIADGVKYKPRLLRAWVVEWIIMRAGRTMRINRSPVHCERKGSLMGDRPCSTTFEGQSTNDYTWIVSVEKGEYSPKPIQSHSNARPSMLQRGSPSLLLRLHPCEQNHNMLFRTTRSQSGEWRERINRPTNSRMTVLQWRQTGVDRLGIKPESMHWRDNTQVDRVPT